MRIEFARQAVAEGESWAETADRLAQFSGSTGVGPALAVDLSADPLRFRIDEDHRFAIRPMTPGDLGDVTRWVNESHVAQWWDDERSPEQVAAYYAPGIRGVEPTRFWVWEVNGRSVGFSQDYRISDHPEHALLCGRPDAIGFDYAVGEPAWVDRGIGTSLLWVYLRDIMAPAYPESSEFFAAPDHRNSRSLRVLEKLGARQGLWFDEPQPNGRVDTVVGCSINVPRVIGVMHTPRDHD